MLETINGANMKKIIIIIITLLIIGTVVDGAKPPGIQNSFGTQISLGLTTRLTSSSDLWAIDVPIIEYSLPFSNDYLHIDLAAILQFGINNFFLDGYSGLTIRFSPLPNYFDLYAKYMFSTGIVLGNHYGHIMQLGANISIPIDKKSYLIFTSGYYWRATKQLLDYLYTDNFYEKNKGLFIGATLRWDI